MYIKYTFECSLVTFLYLVWINKSQCLCRLYSTYIRCDLPCPLTIDLSDEKVPKKPLSV